MPDNFNRITNMKTNELYLKTLFCCCACDGEIAQEEVDMIKELTEFLCQIILIESVHRLQLFGFGFS